jgi:transposase
MKTPKVDNLWNIGIDVAKDTFTSAILPLGAETATIRATFKNAPDGFKKYNDWLMMHLPAETPARVIMESTGIYWVAIHDFVAVLPKISVSIVNPFLIKSYAKSFGRRAKTDSIDAALLAKFGAERKPLPYRPPSEKTAQLRALSRAHVTIVQDMVSYKNRIAQELDKTAKKHYTGVLSRMEKEDEKIQAEMKKIIDDDPTFSTQVKNLKTMPGIGQINAMSLLAEMPEFLHGHPRQMAAYAGLVPQLEDSGTSVHWSVLSRFGNAFLRRTCFQAAVVACMHCEEMKAMKERLIANGKSKKTALCAVAHKILRIASVLVVSNQEFNPSKTVAKQPASIA